MDIYHSALSEVISVPLIRQWPDASTLIERAARSQPKNWLLPGLACRAVGSHPEQTIPATAAIAAMHVSIMLIDDLLDSDPRGEHHRIGVGAAANAAAALQAAAVEIIMRCESVPLPARFSASRSVNNLALSTCFGQHLDTLNPDSEEGYWRAVRCKSSPLFAASFEIGALLGGGSSEVVKQLKRLGEIYGEIMQIHDDLKDTLETPANPDWLMGRSPLPILFAETVNHPDRERFRRLRGLAADPDALAEAQTILIRCGAVSYGVHQNLQRHTAARELLESIPLPHKDELCNWLGLQLEPLRALFQTVAPDSLPAVLA